MAVAEKETQLLTSYNLVVKFLLETYATDGLIQEAYYEVLGYRKRAGITESMYAMKLWKLQTRFSNERSTMRLKSMYAEGVLEALRAQIRNYLTQKTEWWTTAR